MEMVAGHEDWIRLSYHHRPDLVSCAHAVGMPEDQNEARVNILCFGVWIPLYPYMVRFSCLFASVLIIVNIYLQRHIVNLYIYSCSTYERPFFGCCYR
jgi:hypothetical protein